MQKNIEIKFKTINAHGGSQANAFEELCTQIARKSISSLDQFDRFHGDGGDGGVECISTNSDGDVIGWQSKYVFTIDALLKQVNSSLSAAISNYPKLKKFIICFPFDYTGKTGRKNLKGESAKSGKDKLFCWRDEFLKKCKIDGFSLEEIELWPASELTALLLKYDVSGGLRAYFFSDIILSNEWFSNNLISAVKRAGPRYNPKLNIKTGLPKSYAAFGQTSEWFEFFDNAWAELKVPFDKFINHISKSADPVFPGLDSKHTTKANFIVDEVSELKTQFSRSISKNNNQLNELLRNRLQVIISKVKDLEEEITDDLNAKFPNENWDTKQWRNHMLEYMVSAPTNALDNVRILIEKLENFELFLRSEDYRLYTESVFILSGIGGSGKTHSICDISEHRLQKGELSIIISGDQFEGSPNEWIRFAEIIGLVGQNKDVILDSLNVAAEISGKPLIIFLDAINETNPRSYWMDKIVSFSNEISKRPFLKLCVSCRSSFLKASLPDHHSFVTIEHIGFKGLEHEACNEFFKFFDLKPPLLPILHPEMGNPLYLKLLCSTLKAKGLKNLPVGWNGIRPVINEFLKEKDKQLCIQFDLPRNLSTVQKALTTIVKEIASKGQASISWSLAVLAITQNNPPIDSHKLLQWLVNSDLLIEDGSIIEDDFVSETTVRPAFERLGDFLLAIEVGRIISEGFNNRVKNQTVFYDIFNSEDSINENYGLIQALSVILPETYNIELPSLFINDNNYKLLCCISTEALTWRTTDSISSETEIFVRESLSNDGFVAMDALFSICTIPSYLDALWLHNIFFSVELAKRDSFLSQYFLFSYEQSQIVKKLISIREEIDVSSMSIDTALRWLIVLVWLNAAPDRRIKDGALRQAVFILRYFPSLTDKLFDLFIEVNDEEIRERLLLILYGTFIISQNKVELASICKKLKNNFLINPSIFENALIRDHSRCLFELGRHVGCISDLYDPFIFTNKKPIDNWYLELPGEEARKNWSESKGAIRLANRSCFFDDFNHYSINCLDVWLGKNSKNDIAAWIMNDIINRIGLCNNLHSNYDIEILNSTGGGRSKPSYAERIGKKYQWNSMYRLASILHDNASKIDRGYQPKALIEGLILQEERKIDPTLTQPFFKENSTAENWWLGNVNGLNFSNELSLEDWLNSQNETPLLNELIKKTCFEGQNWIPLNMYITISDSDTDFDNPYKFMSFSVQSLIVNNCDLEKVKKKLENCNLNDLVPGIGNFMYSYLGEYPWASSNNTEPDWYLGVGDTFSETDIKAFNTINTIVCEWEYDGTIKENMHIPVPHKNFFRAGSLWWNGIDGFKNEDNITVFKDPRFSTGGNNAFISDFDDLQN